MVKTVTVEVPLHLIKRIKPKMDLCKSCPFDKRLICYLSQGEFCEEYKYRRMIHNKVRDAKFFVIPRVCMKCKFQKHCYYFKHKLFGECKLARLEQI